MAAPNIDLGTGEVLVTQSNSGLGIDPLKSGLNFGLVAKINDLCDSVAVNDLIMYDATKGKNIWYGSTIYTLINEENISGVEVIPP